MKTDNEFGAQTYWNRPTVGRLRKLPSKYPNIKPKVKANKAKSSTRSVSPTPSSTSTVSAVISPSRSAHHHAANSSDEENDNKDEKTIVKLMKSKLPQISNENDWELSIFELSLILDRIWPHKDELDICDYMTSEFHRRSLSGDMEDRADRLIYFALTTCAKKDSFAKLQIVAASHKDA
jgi:hypothetical protein